MKNRKPGIFLWIFGGVLLGLSIIGVIAYFAVASNTEVKYNSILIISIIGVLISFVFLIVGYILSFLPDKEAKQRIALYSSYPVKNIEDYKKELESVRGNFNADKNPEKNQIAAFNFINSRQCYDFSVINKGKIYYAYLVRAFPPFYSYNNFARLTLPAVIVYSTEEYFESNPMALKAIAKKFLDSSNTNVLRDDSNFFTNLKLPVNLTDGREVYATTVMAYRMHLPLYYFSDSLFPIIADPNNSPSAFIEDFKYWTVNQVGNFSHGVAQNAEEKIGEEESGGIFDV